jgi:hypothetical protein
MNEKPRRWVTRVVDVLPADLPRGDFSAKGLKSLDPRKTCLDCGYLYSVHTHQVDASEEGEAVFESSPSLVNIADRNTILRGNNISQAKAMDLQCFRSIWAIAFSIDKRKMVEEGLNQATKKRRCPFFFSLSPGDSPEVHRELHRERTARRSNIIAGVIGGFIGGLLTLGGAFLIWYLSQGSR